MSQPIPMLTPNSTWIKRILWKGMRGEDVKYLQESLDELNKFYKFCPNAELKVTGFFGDDTARFVKFFQYKEGLIPDCHVDKATSDRLEYRWEDYLDIQTRSNFKYKNQTEYLNSRFED